MKLIGGIGASNLLEIEKTSNPNISSNYHSPGLAYKIGLGISKNITNKIAIQPKVIYSKRGATYFKETKWNLNYLDISLNGLYSLNNKIVAGIGPQLSIHTQSTAILNHERYPLTVTPDKKLDIGVNLDLHYYLTTKFGIGIHYFQGFIPVYKLTFTNTDGSNIGKYATYNQQLLLSLNYTLF